MNKRKPPEYSGGWSLRTIDRIAWLIQYIHHTPTIQQVGLVLRPYRRDQRVLKPISGTPTDIFYVSAPYDIMQGLKTEQADTNPELIETAINPMFSKYGILIIVLIAITPIPYKLSAVPPMKIPKNYIQKNTIVSRHRKFRKNANAPIPKISLAYQPEKIFHIQKFTIYYVHKINNTCGLRMGYWLPHDVLSSKIFLPLLFNIFF